MARITIIGLGLIGGSLGISLRRAKVGAEIVGHDLHHENAGKARQLGAIDRAEWNLPAAVDKASVVVVATPVAAVKTVLEQVADLLPEGCVVTDTAGTKEQVLRWADEILPATVGFVGGHPMAGKEVSGIEHAGPDLFAGCTYCLCPSPRAQSGAVDLVAALVSAVGASPYFIEPAEHDSFVAAISHLPFILATALVNTTAQTGVWHDMSRLASSGFRDSSRLASGDPVMHRDVCLTNRDRIVRWLDAYAAELAEMRRMVESGDDALEKAFAEAKDARDRWLSGQSQHAPPSPDIPSVGDALRQMLLGNLQPRFTKK